MPRRWGAAATALALCASGGALCACGEAPPDPPTAVVHSDPASVCENDAFATMVTLDASASSQGLTLVPSAADPELPPLTFEWSLAGAEHRIEGREPKDIGLLVTTRGDRPLHATLTVRTADGGEAVTTHTLPITRLSVTRCDDGVCPAALRCIEHLGEQVCTQRRLCRFDSDCAVCWGCSPSGQCVPREVPP